MSVGGQPIRGDKLSCYTGYVVDSGVLYQCLASSKVNYSIMIRCLKLILKYVCGFRLYGIDLIGSLPKPEPGNQL